MSAATTVPERYESSGQDAREQIRRTGVLRLLVNASRRFRAADGTSYARALGLSSVLSLIPALIAAVGLATTYDLENYRLVLGDTVRSLAPGPAGRILTEALQARGTGSTALIAGAIGMLVSGTLAMVQLERGANNIYGVEEDRPLLKRYGLAFLLAASVGVLLLLGLVVIAAGGAIGDAARSAGAWTGSTSTIWSFLRWPVGVALVTIAMTVIFKVVPNRHQPHLSWLVSGTTVAVSAWIGITLLLALFYEHASSLGKTYGPLLGVVALLLWAYLTGVAVLFGLAFAAEMEAIRAREAGSWDRDEEEVVYEVPEAETETAIP